MQIAFRGCGKGVRAFPLLGGTNYQLAIFAVPALRPCPVRIGIRVRFGGRTAGWKAMEIYQARQPLREAESSPSFTAYS
jgi:hypothetical protein